jgi:hypothetical protein
MTFFPFTLTMPVVGFEPLYHWIMSEECYVPVPLKGQFHKDLIQRL